ncbi:MAG: NADPH-dependent assimilatory sulfite reductase hemoprotein subunit, partial [Rhodanobacteraceae bacterium]
VMVSPNPVQSHAHARVYECAARLSAHLRPQSRAYHEIWLDEERVAGSGEEEEPIYGATYLPRKFKIAFTVPPQNDVDVFANDLGFIAILENGELVGFNVTVGGGLGATHGDDATYPRLADVIGFVSTNDVLAVAEAVLTVQRDFGNRAERKRARLKYTIDDRGLEWFVAEVERRFGTPLAPARPFAFEHNGDRFGWTQGHDGHWHLTLHLEAGRIADRGAQQHLTGLREIARAHRGDFRITPNQNLIVASVAEEHRADIDALVARFGLDGFQSSSRVRRDALACVAFPTCSLAMAEAERYLPAFIDHIEALLVRNGLGDAPIHVRISGCPNGCSRPYLGEIALVGKAPGRYNLMLGADERGQRLNRLYRENIAEGDILETLDALFARYAAERDTDERFGNFVVRAGIVPERARRILMEIIA